MRCIDLPIIVCGEIRTPDGADDVLELEYSSGVKLRLPRLREEDVETVLQSRQLLHEIPLAEVSRYLGAGGARWVDPSYPVRRAALDIACDVTGFSRPMLERDFWVIGDYLMFRNNYYDLLDAELGDHRMVDEWVHRQVARVRAFPRGRVLHVMVGNVPMAGVYSMVRSILTKNHTIVKLPARDPSTCVHFARALIQENGADHPISRSLTVAYWEKDSPLWNTMIAASDMICAWGQGSSLARVKAKVPHSVPFLEFGPKRSLAIVFADECDPLAAATRVAHDVSVYDQEACFSPQRLFVVGDHRKLIPHLKDAFAQQQRFLPKGATSPDVESHIVRTRLEAVFRNTEVISSNEGWSIIVSPDPLVSMEHPLSRTLFVHPITSPKEVLPFIDDETQTIAAFPFKPHAEALGDLFCARGAARICEAGMVSHFRQGFTHDGTYALQHFMRLAYLDRELEFIHKYGGRPTPGQLETFFFGTSTRERVVP
ncbi:MAG: hypothetical protein HY698_19395 [Deltaproteobacteria bacterium]|nr:hypothetical protein [Deltaproteobacteria bacterium]